MRTRTAAILLLLFATTILLAQSSNPRDLFQQALVRQTANGDIHGAIPIYERIVRDFSSDHPLAAKALVQLGRCYELLGNPVKARIYYQQIVNNYSDQTDIVRDARAHLEAADKPDTLRNIATPPTDDPFSFAISPDGRSVVFAVTAAGLGELWLHDLVTGKSAPIAGANLERSSIGPSGDAAPFWSPDGKSIGFFSDQKLKRIAATGGTAKTLADAPAPAGGTWSQDGVIVFTPSVFGLYRVPADGSEAAAPIAMGRYSHPQFLPDGKHFLFYSLTVAAAAGVGQTSQVLRVGSLDNSEVRPLQVQALSGAFASPDQLLYAAGAGIAPGAALFSRRIDLQSLELTGTSTPLLDRVAVTSVSGAVAVSTSASGRLAYRVGLSLPDRQFVWLDRKGQPAGVSFLPDPSSPCCARISADGRTIAFGRTAASSSPFGSVWTIDNADGAQARRLGIGAQVAVWSSMGSGIVLGLLRPEKPVSNLASGPSSILRESADGEQPDDWSRDGRFLLYEKIAGGDLMALPLRPGSSQQAGVPIPVAQTPAAERNGRFSPGGNWVAYQSNAVGGRNEIFLQPFPGSPDNRQRVSINGGTSPAWRGDGHELFFLSPDFHLMVVTIKFEEDGGVSIGTPAPLFPAALPIGSEYDASWEGQRFLINRPGPTNTPPIIVISNWSRSK